MGDALGGVADFMRDFDPYADQKREQSYRLVESQIASLNAGTLSRPPSVGRSTRRSYASPDYEVRPSGNGGRLSKGNAPGEGKIVGGDDPAVSSMGWRWSNGEHGYFEAPWMPDAEVWEKIVGDNELFSTIYSIAKVGNDLGYSAYRNAVAPLSKAKKIKPDNKYRREYFKNISESVPSLNHR